MCPRSELPTAKKRPEASKAGVYLLASPSAESEIPRVYIGEGDPILARLEQHAVKKDFWTYLVAFASKDDNLNKAHVQYLESRLIELAQAAKRCELENSNKPERPSLSESDEAECEAFLAEMLLCFPVVGIHFFEEPPTTSPRHELQVQAKGITAKGYDSPQGFVVLKDSQAVSEEVPSLHHSVSNFRKHLLASGVLTTQGSLYVFAQDYTFTSPSTAASVILGRMSNGRIEWKDKEGQTLKDIQEQL